MCDKKCLTAEFGTKIFAYFNLVLMVLTSLSVYGFTVYFIMVLFYYKVDHIWVVLIIIFLLLLLGPTSALTFSIILFNGVRKEKPNLIFAYIIYGIVVLLLTIIGSFLLMFVPAICYEVFEEVCEIPPAALAAPLFVCAVYGLILFMIGKTYRQFQKARYQGLKCISPENQEKKILL